ncbi:MAG: oxidoreductase [Anaerolineaceae bacterium]|nr:oxidoreductase [Anaerolineaceae bacterium]MAU12154.1 oxidoreductase [Anaerolineaceae bacterium]
MKTIRWGIIGVGDVCEVKSGPGFQKAENSALVAVMRRDAAKAQDFAERHQVPRWYDQAEDFINDPEVDAVYIATPPHVHKRYTLMAAEAGKPVFVEKPMAINFEECQAMVDACNNAGVPLWVAYYRRCLPKFRKIKALVDSGAIGQVRTVSITLRANKTTGPQETWRVNTDVSGGGHFVDVGVHSLDYLDYLLGPIAKVSGYALNQGGHYAAEDNVVTSFVFESGVTGTGSWCFTSEAATDDTVITGTKGILRYATFTGDPIVLTTASGEESIPVEWPAHVHQNLIQTIVDELNGQGQSPSTGESGARTTWVTDQILQSTSS